MNIFDLAIDLTIKQDGTGKDFVENALKIRQFIDTRPKFTKMLFESELSDTKQRYMRKKIYSYRRKNRRGYKKWIEA